MEKSGRLILDVAVMLCIGFVFGIVSTGCENKTPSKEQMKTAPLIRGTLWWIAHEEKINKWTKSRFAEEIQAQVDVGFDLLWVFNTPNLMNMAIKADAAGKPRDVIGMIYEIADEKGMRVIANLPKAGWYGKTTAKEIIAKNRLFIEQFYTRYGAQLSFYGWYLNYEINPIHPSEEDKSRFWRQTWKGIVAECHRVAPDSVVTISPFFLLDKDSLRGFTYLTPEEYEQWWGTTLKETGIDILMLQDSGEHLAFFTLEQREPFFTAFANACRKAGTQFWLNVETGEVDVANWEEYLDLEKKGDKEPSSGTMPWRFTPMDWLDKKLHLAARYGTNIVNWGYYPFMAPSPLPGGERQGQREAYEAYKAYYKRIAKSDAKGVKIVRNEE